MPHDLRRREEDVTRLVSGLINGTSTHIQPLPPPSAPPPPGPGHLVKMNQTATGSHQIKCQTSNDVKVLYNMFTFVADMPQVESVDVFLGMARFLVVGLGGLLFGLLFGVAGAFTSRFAHKVRSIEPLFVFMYSYLAIVVCAITMRYYVEENVSRRSCTTIRHVVKMLASISETHLLLPGREVTIPDGKVQSFLRRHFPTSDTLPPRSIWTTLFVAKWLLE
ncbi:hypothetical protein CRUP_033670, partial [Coryphaenoides rupestris]